MAALLYLAGAALLAASAAVVGRPIPKPLLALFIAAPLVAFLPDIAGHETRLPTDQTYLLPDAQPLPPAPHNPWLNDLATQFLPWAAKVRDSWRSGEVPLRDFWNGCGSPLAAGPAAPFSPFALLFVLLPLTRAFGVAAALKGFTALAGMWLWLRELRASKTAALFGAVSFALSFAIAAWIFFPIAAAVAAWPWVFFAVERTRDPGASGERRVASTDRAEPGTGLPGSEPRRAFALLVAVFAIWPLLGHIESVVSGVALLAVVLAIRWASGDLPNPARLLRRVLLSGAAGAGLAAFVLVPQALAILSSNRRALAGTFLARIPFGWPHGFLWPGWRTTLFPRAFGDLIETPMLPAAHAAFPEMALGYVGIAAWALALLVVRPGSPRARATASLVSAIVLGLALGLGAWPFAELTPKLPLLSWMLPVRLLAWVAFAAPTLAALELDRWLRDLDGPRRRSAVFSAIASAAVLALLARDTHLRYGAAQFPHEALPAAGSALRLTLWTLAAFALVALAAWAPTFRRAAPGLLVLLPAVELSIQAARLYRTSPAGDVYPPTPLTRFLASRPGRWRVVGEGSELFPERNVFAGLEDVRTHDPIERRDYVEFLDATLGYSTADYFKRVARIDAPALGFLNARYLVSFPGRGASGPWTPLYSGADGSVLENRLALPRVFAPARVTGVAGEPPRGRVGNGLNPFRPVLPEIAALEDFGAHAFVLGQPAGERENGPVEIADYAESGSRVSFRSRASAPAVLATSLVQDGGWTARDGDGSRLETTLVDGPFLAVIVPAGQTRVRLAYAPPGWRWGLALSGATALLLAAAAAGRRRMGAPS